MKHQSLFSSEKKLKCRLLQSLFGALRVRIKIINDTSNTTGK